MYFRAVCILIVVSDLQSSCRFSTSSRDHKRYSDKERSICTIHATSVEHMSTIHVTSVYAAWRSPCLACGTANVLALRMLYLS